MGSQEDGPEGNADRDRVARFLIRIRSNTIAEVLAAEERASKKIVGRREAHLRAVATFLFRQAGHIAGEDLRKSGSGSRMPDGWVRELTTPTWAGRSLNLVHMGGPEKIRGGHTRTVHEVIHGEL